MHRNFKSANILLDDELNPHVSDCGLSALAPSSAELQVYLTVTIVDATRWTLLRWLLDGLNML